MPLDVIIIGGSFAGLSAAMQLARGQRHVTVIDAGEPRNRFSDESHGFFGLDCVSPFAIQQEAYRQLLNYPTATIVQGKATTVEKQAQGFDVTLEDGTLLSSKKLILATGLRDEIPDIPGLKERWGATVIHCPYCHGYEVRNQPLGVIATSPLSIHQAGMIPDWGPTTYFTQGEFEYKKRWSDSTYKTNYHVLYDSNSIKSTLLPSPAIGVSTLLTFTFNFSAILQTQIVLEKTCNKTLTKEE